MDETSWGSDIPFLGGKGPNFQATALSNTQPLEQICRGELLYISFGEKYILTPFSRQLKPLFRTFYTHLYTAYLL